MIRFSSVYSISHFRHRGHFLDLCFSRNVNSREVQGYYWWNFFEIINNLAIVNELKFYFRFLHFLNVCVRKICIKSEQILDLVEHRISQVKVSCNTKSYVLLLCSHRMFECNKVKLFHNRVIIFQNCCKLV